MHLFVSNRSPYLHSEPGRAFRMGAEIGGLVSTMEPVFRKLGGVWIGSKPDSESATTALSSVDGAPQCFTRDVNLSEAEICSYYAGFANSTLWPLCHEITGNFSYHQRNWETYRAVNRKLAATIRYELEDPDSVVWIHDYHLALTPGFVREIYPEQSIASFWHIPFPPARVFHALAPARQILEGLLRSSFIGFHIDTYAKNFLECAAELVPGTEVDEARSRVRFEERCVEVDAVPLGVDFKAWQTWANSAHVIEQASSIRAGRPGEKLFLSVDRVDYTKGLLERLQAIDLFLVGRPEFRSRIRFIQIAIPTRLQIETYQNYLTATRDLAQRINAKFRTEAWQPIEWLEGMRPQSELAAWYAAADVACVTPLRDGMNLVAKEFVATRVREPGALLLSREAGASRALGSGAFLVRPQPRDIADGFARALAAEHHELTDRMRNLRGVVREYDLHWWLNAIQGRIAEQKRRTTAPRELPPTSRPRRLAEQLREYAPILLMLDFDGTLVPLQDDPQAVYPSFQLQEVLAELGNSPDFRVVIVTGRSHSDLDQRLRIPGVLIVASHGAEYSGRLTRATEKALRQIAEARELISAIVREYPGTTLEEKPAGLTLHTRRASPANALRAQSRAKQEIAYRNLDELVLQAGNNVLELIPVDVNKGRAVRGLIKMPEHRGRYPVYVGDDLADEQAFEAVAEFGASIRVQSTRLHYRTNARYSLKDTAEVGRFLACLRR